MSSNAGSLAVEQSVDSPLTGILLIVLGMVFFSIQDVSIRLMSGSLSVVQIMFIRGTVAIVPLTFMVLWRGGFWSFKTQHPFLNALRSCLMVCCYLLFYSALATVPIAEVTAILFAAPLITTLLSIFILKETVGIRRWVAVVAGFIGVLVIVRPGSNSLEPAALLVLVAAFCYSCSIMITRHIGRNQSGASLAFFGMLGFLVLSGIGGLAFGDGAYGGLDHPSLEFVFRGWSMPDTREWLLLVLCGFIATGGFYCLSQGYRVAPVSIVAPFEYVALPMAVIWGLAIWNEVPATTTLIGIALIVGSGIYVIHRERLQSRKINQE